MTCLENLGLSAFSVAIESIRLSNLQPMGVLVFIFTCKRIFVQSLGSRGWLFLTLTTLGEFPCVVRLGTALKAIGSHFLWRPTVRSLIIEGSIVKQEAGVGCSQIQRRIALHSAVIKAGLTSLRPLGSFSLKNRHLQKSC